MSDIVTGLAAMLSQVRRPGDFYTSGTTELLAPALSVDGVGPIALPLLPAQAAQLVAAAERAPYGRGPDTIVDTSVRNTWQIAPEHVRIGGRHWPRTLETILGLVGEGLGVSDAIEAEFYKLLIYDKGSFFVSHRDTEKSPGMFATLVIVLPSSCAGGELVVRHKDRSARLDLRSDDPGEVAFAAFYADCLHEVLPVTEGCRLTLTYNLIRRGTGGTPEPPNYTSEQDQVAALLREWRGQMDTDAEDADVPQKLVYPLEHAYTAPELGFPVLKGADAAAAGVLVAAARQADCALHLALVEVMESGSADYAENYGYRRSRRRWDDDDDDDGDGGVEFEIDEVGDRYTTLSDWRAYDGQPVSWGEIPVWDDELSPPDPFHALKPDELHFEEASGNAGVTFERRYRRAALVVWPNDRTMAVLTQAGVHVTVPHLSDLTERWAASGAKTGSPAWQEAHSLAGYMIDEWPEHGGGHVAEGADSAATGMLKALTRLGDMASIEAFLKRVTAAGSSLVRADIPAIVTALRLFSANAAADLLERIVTGNGTKRFAACADLLAQAATGLPALQPAGLTDAATMLIGTLPSTAPAYDYTHRTDTIDAGFVADLLTALSAIDTRLAGQAVSHMLSHPETYDPDAILVPASRDCLRSADIAMQPAVAQLRETCLAHLSARIAQPLAPPSDWSRPSALACRCRHCSELSLFLADQKQKIWVFRAVAADREHVENTIRTARCDVDTKTETRGRPYSLICTKNQASYERRVEQRRQDLADAERLRAVGEG
jgi:2OG-Fe(II) oxygenase superfamily